jgi:hypothetical protein
MRPIISSVVVVSLSVLAAQALAAESPEVAVVLASPLPRPPSAEAPPDFAPARTGFQLGVRFSVQVPAGGFGGGSSFSDLLGPRGHAAFDIGSKLNPYFFFGGYLGVGFGTPGATYGDACNATDASGNSVSCTAESVDAGLVGIVTFLPSDFVDPWLGATLGYEVQGLEYGGATGLFTGVSPSLLGGVDFRLRNETTHTGLMSVGPYVGVTFQRYFTGAVNGSSTDTSDEPFHMWLHFGVRATFPG